MGKKLNYFTAIKFLSKYIFKHKRNFIMFYFGFFFDMLLSIAMPILFGIMIDEIVYYQNLDTFLEISFVFVIMTAFSCILYFFIYAQHSYLMSMYTFDIKKDIFDHLQKSDAQYMTDAHTGDIISTINWYTSECMHFMIRNVIHFINGIISIIVITIYLFIISWQIGLFVCIAAPVLVFINAKFGKKIREYGDEQRENYDGYVSWVYEILSGLRSIRMLGAQNKTNESFKENHRKIFSVNVKSSVSSMTMQNLVSFTNLCVQLAIFGLAGYLAYTGEMSIGLLSIVVTFFTMLTGKIGYISSNYLDAQNRVSYIQRIYDFLQTPTEDEWKGTKDLQVTDGHVVFKNIGFSYKGSEAILEDFNLEIGAGERFALVSKSGSGKTTLAYMLIGFYRPQMGHIEIDGQKLSECSLKSIRQNIGLVQQDVLIFDGTIKENLLFGHKGATEEELLLACTNAGLIDFIESLPQKLETEIGKNGIGLSGGQRQRISIARIYLKNPKIIIFDEATSSLDAETEESIHEAWKDALVGKTSIVIAHRQSSVMFCEKVALLDNGKVCEVGIPREMIEHSTLFKTLFAVKGGIDNA